MDISANISTLLIITTAIFSYYGFVNAKFFDAYALDAGSILRQKDYKRLFTSGFLHVGWMHLIFNVLTLHAFGDMLETYTGARYFSIIYLSSLLGGNLLALYLRRQDFDYVAVGASGAINGVIFASVALMDTSIGFFGLPFSIPSWIYALLYTCYTLYGIQSRRDNVGHEAHLGGAFTGLLAAILYEPRCLVDHALPIMLALVPTAVFLYLVVKKPGALVIMNSSSTQRKYNYTIDDRYNAQKVEEQLELDKILEKIHKKGINSLTKAERDFLDQHAQ